MSISFDDQKLDTALRHALEAAGGFGGDEIDALVRDSILRRRSARSVGVAVAKLPPVPSGFTRATQATENAWKQIEDEFGLLTSTEVASRIGSKNPHRALASDMRKRGQLIGVSRLNSYRYPGFQFTADGTVHQVIAPLLKAAKNAGWSEASLTLWLANPSGSFGGDRPVDRLNDSDFVPIASDLMTTDW